MNKSPLIISNACIIPHNLIALTIAFIKKKTKLSVSSGDFAHLRIPGYFAHLLQHLKMKENDNSENSMIKNNPSLV